MQSFSEFAYRLIELLLLRKGPQDLPASRKLLQFSGALLLLVSVLRQQLVASFPAAIVQSGLSILVLVLFVHLMLGFRRHPERLVQTLTALFLANAVIGALSLLPLRALAPVLLALTTDPALAQSIQLPTLAAYAWLLIGIWGLLVAAHIYRNAMDTRLGAGICIALLYELSLIVVVSLSGIVGAA